MSVVADTERSDMTQRLEDIAIGLIFIKKKKEENFLRILRNPLGVDWFSVMDNHLHLLVRLDPDVAQGWSDKEVARRWGRLFPRRDSRCRLPRIGCKNGSGTSRGRRLFRDGKAAILANLAGIFERLGSRAENWHARMERLRKGRLFGRFFAASQARMRELAGHLGARRIANLAGFPAQS
jgi:hypothetical protein